MQIKSIDLYTRLIIASLKDDMMIWTQPNASAITKPLPKCTLRKEELFRFGDSPPLQIALSDEDEPETQNILNVTKEWLIKVLNPTIAETPRHF